MGLWFHFYRKYFLNVNIVNLSSPNVHNLHKILHNLHKNFQNLYNLHKILQNLHNLQENLYNLQEILHNLHEFLHNILDFFYLQLGLSFGILRVVKWGVSTPHRKVQGEDFGVASLFKSDYVPNRLRIRDPFGWSNRIDDNERHEAHRSCNKWRTKWSAAWENF